MVQHYVPILIFNENLLNGFTLASQIGFTLARRKNRKPTWAQLLLN